MQAAAVPYNDTSLEEVGLLAITIPEENNVQRGCERVVPINIQAPEEKTTTTTINPMSITKADLEEETGLLSASPYNKKSLQEFLDEHEHYSHRTPWLRAFVLGALDGLVSVACTIVGVSGGRNNLLLIRVSGLSAWIACSMAMAASEYVSVASQMDCEEADIQKERDTQAAGPLNRAKELDELAMIYVNRGLDPVLAHKVAEELSSHDVIRAHARDELGIDIDEMSNPMQAAVVSTMACTIGAIIPILSGFFILDNVLRIYIVAGATAAACIMFGVIASALGGAGLIRGGLRVFIGGCISMGITYGVGRAFGATIG